jgi:exo-beta-1,3-glucanase (GH17 family)
MPIVHPVFGDHAHPQATCGWMLHRTCEVTARAPGRAVIFAEVGFPTSGAPALTAP